MFNNNYFIYFFFLILNQNRVHLTNPTITVLQALKHTTKPPLPKNLKNDRSFTRSGIRKRVWRQKKKYTGQKP